MKQPVEWNNRDIAAVRNRNFGNGILAALPALYGWQVHGWIFGLIMFAILLVTFAAIGWGIVSGRIRPSHAVWYRGIILVVAFAGVGLSAMEVVRP